MGDDNVDDIFIYTELLPSLCLQCEEDKSAVGQYLESLHTGAGHKSVCETLIISS